MIGDLTDISAKEEKHYEWQVKWQNYFKTSQHYVIMYFLIVISIVLLVWIEFTL